MTPPSSRRLAAAAALAPFVALAVPLVLAAAGILLPGTQPADGTGDPAFPPFRNGALPGTLARPGACDNCHAGYRASTEPIYEPFDTWAGSMMANAARDPLFWAALDIANQDDDEALGDAGVGDFCLRCHVPKAWYEGRSTCTTAWGESFDGSCLVGPMSQVDNDFEGLTCAYCHRMYDASNPPPGQFLDPAAPRAGNAQVYLSSDERTWIGPFSDADPFAHQFLGSPFFRSAALCGQCHDVTSPALNRRDPATGADTGARMPIERTYSEWRQSRYADLAAPEAATCQECHMPAPDHDGDGRVDDAYACSQMPGLRGEGTALDGPVRKHVFAGANTFMLNVLRGEYGAALNRLDQFDATIAATEAMHARALEVDVTAPPSVDAGQPLAITVRVTNLAGHKFPTGYPEGRRAFINVRAGTDDDADGTLSATEVLWESAAYDAATGVLAHDAQAKVYEAKLGIWNFNGTGACDLVDGAGDAMFHFVRNDCWAEDNRIPPLGFVPDADTAPAGYTYPPNPALPGTLANWDDTGYTIPVPLLASGSLLIEARVRYQSTSKEYVDFLVRANRSTCDPFDAGCNPTQPDDRPNRAEKFRGLWEAYGRSQPVDVARGRASVAVVAAGPGACCTAGACEVLDPAACVAREGSFLGTGSTCAAVDPCGVVPPPPGEASDVPSGAAPLRVARAGAALRFTWEAACDSTDHVLAWGPLSGVRAYDWSGFDCAAGASGPFDLAAPAGSWFFVVVGQNGVAEGSYGRDSFGVERPQRVGGAACALPQDLSATCR